jgi:hypothetical protein
MNTELLSRLAPEDDAELWEVVLATVLADPSSRQGMEVDIGRCSHWLRPHQSHWLADGQFALPRGYGPLSRRPLCDWSIALQLTGREWTSIAKKSEPSVTVTIPSRTRRHAQAAVHTIWRIRGENCLRLYGFRRARDGWQLTAASIDQVERNLQRRQEKDRLKTRASRRQDSHVS